MPLYDYGCERGHVTESREGVDTASILCRCGRMATRAGVYREQYRAHDVAAPRDERSYRQEFREYIEAREEVADGYARAEAEGVKVEQPDYLGMAKRRARAGTRSS